MTLARQDAAGSVALLSSVKSALSVDTPAKCGSYGWNVLRKP